MLPDRLSSSLEKMITWLATILLIGFWINVLLQVGTRYITKSPLIWTEEAARYLNLWAMFLGATVVTKNKKHLGVYLLSEIIDEKLPKSAQVVYELVVDVVILLTLPLLVAGSYYMVIDRWHVALSTMPVLSIGQIYIGMFTSCCLMFIFVLDNIINGLRKIALAGK